MGAVAAILLGRRGYRVTVYEARPDPRLVWASAGRSINLTLAERGWDALRLAGIDESIRELSLPLRGRMIHADDGELRFQHYTPGGDAIYSASRAGITARLLELADEEPGVTVRFGHRCEGVDLARRMLRLRTMDGTAIDASPDRLLAADGAFSAVRRSLLRDPDFDFYQRLSPIYYRELRIAPSGDGDFAYSRDALHLWPRGDCMIVGFPNIDHSFTLSVFLPAQGEISFASFSERSALDRFLEESCPDLALNLRTPAHDFFNGPPAPLFSSGCSPWVHDGWLSLIGDAAHTLVPFLGQGLNAGLEDCSVLMRCLEDAAHDWPSALDAFQDERVANCEAVIQLAEDHYDELARAARDPGFVRRKALEERLHSYAPDRFVPLYTMVAFESRPYTEIARARGRHEAVLDHLCATSDIEERWDTLDGRLEIERALSLLRTPTDGRAATRVGATG